MDLENEFDDNITLPDTKPKRDKKAAFPSTSEGEAPSVRRIVIRITGYRVNPLDPDNFAGSCKDIIDGLKHAGLIYGDEWDKIKFEPDQRRVPHFRQEKTVVEIIYPEEEAEGQGCVAG